MIPYFYVPYFDLGLTQLETHATMVGIGLLLAHFRFLVLAPDRDRAAELSWPVMIAGVLVGHLSFLALAEWRIPFAVAWFPLTGLLALPAMLTALAVAAWKVRSWEIGVTEIGAWGDAATRAFLPAWVVIKLGCFLLHDTPGLATSLPWAVQFPDEPRHDLALYDIVWALGVMTRPSPRVVLASYGVLRIGLYFLRLEQHGFDLVLAFAVLLAGLLWDKLTFWLAAASSPSDPYPAGRP